MLFQARHRQRNQPSRSDQEEERARDNSTARNRRVILKNPYDRDSPIRRNPYTSDERVNSLNNRERNMLIDQRDKGYLGNDHDRDYQRGDQSKHVENPRRNEQDLHSSPWRNRGHAPNDQDFGSDDRDRGISKNNRNRDFDEIYHEEPSEKDEWRNSRRRDGRGLQESDHDRNYGNDKNRDYAQNMETRGVVGESHHKSSYKSSGYQSAPQNKQVDYRGNEFNRTVLREHERDTRYPENDREVENVRNFTSGDYERRFHEKESNVRVAVADHERGLIDDSRAFSEGNRSRRFPAEDERRFTGDLNRRFTDADKGDADKERDHGRMAHRRSFPKEDREHYVDQLYQEDEHRREFPRSSDRAEFYRDHSKFSRNESRSNTDGERETMARVKDQPNVQDRLHYRKRSYDTDKLEIDHHVGLPQGSQSSSRETSLSYSEMEATKEFLRDNPAKRPRMDKPLRLVHKSDTELRERAQRFQEEAGTSDMRNSRRTSQESSDRGRWVDEPKQQKNILPTRRNDRLEREPETNERYWKRVSRKFILLLLIFVISY